MNLDTSKYLARLKRPNNPPLTGANIVSAPQGVSAFRVVLIHELTDEENQGNHNVYVDQIDNYGVRVDSDHAWRLWYGWEGMRPDERPEPAVFDKPEGEPGVNVPIFKGVKAWVEMLSYASSDRVTGLDARTGHTSYYVVFQWQETGIATPPVGRTVSVSVDALLDAEQKANELLGMIRSMRGGA